MKFKYKAQIQGGEIIEAVAEAADKFDLARTLRTEGKRIISAKPVDEAGGSWLSRLDEFVSRVSIKERIFFANNLSEMVTAGLTLSRALSVLERQTKNRKMRKILNELLSTVEAGGGLAAGLAKFPKVFPRVFVAMVEAGEKSGRLPESLKIVSDQLSKSYELRKKVRGALIYPAIIIVAMVLIGVLMLIFVVPTLAETFEEIGAQLPFSTRVLIFISNLIVENGLLGFGILVIAVVAVLRARKSERGKRASSWFILKLPIFGNISRQFNSAVTSRTISSLVTAGVDIVEAIGITKNVLANPYYKEVMTEAAERIPKGESLSAVFKRHENLYPVFVGEMVEVGEETGRLPETLLKMAVFYENEVEAITRDLSTVIEPVLMILVGAAVAFFSLSMIQPIYSIGSQL